MDDGGVELSVDVKSEKCWMTKKGRHYIKYTGTADLCGP